jgi:hypothetical protein
MDLEGSLPYSQKVAYLNQLNPTNIFYVCYIPVVREA